jgi:hypothetical protein
MEVHMSKKALVCGAGGFIGSHLVSKLKQEGFWVRGVDLKYPEFAATDADDFIKGDLRDASLVRNILDTNFDEIYQLAADMGGAGFVFTGENDAAIVHNSLPPSILMYSKHVAAKILNAFFILHQRAFTRNITKEIPITQSAPKIQPIRPLPIANMVGKNYLVKDYTSLMPKTMAWKCALLGITTSLALLAAGLAGAKNLQLQSAEK